MQPLPFQRKTPDSPRVYLHLFLNPRFYVTHLTFIALSAGNAAVYARTMEYIIFNEYIFTYGLRLQSDHASVCILNGEIGNE